MPSLQVPAQSDQPVQAPLFAMTWLGAASFIYVSVSLLSPATIVWNWPLQPATAVLFACALFPPLWPAFRLGLQLSLRTPIGAALGCLWVVVVGYSLVWGGGDIVTRYGVQAGAYFLMTAATYRYGPERVLKIFAYAALIFVLWLPLGGWTPGSLSAVAGNFINYTSHAYIFAIAFLYFFSRSLALPDGRLISFLLSLLSMTMILLLGGRGGQISATICLIFVLTRHSQWNVVTITIFGAISVLLLPLALPDQYARLSSIFDWSVGSSNGYRLAIYDATLDHLRSFPLVGLDQAGATRLLDVLTGGVYRHFATGDLIVDADFVWISLLAGVPGATCYILLLLALLYSLWHIRGDAKSVTVLLILVIVVWSALDNLLLFQTGWQLMGVVTGDIARKREPLSAPPKKAWI